MMITIAEALTLGAEKLQHLPNPPFETTLLLAFSLKVNRSYLIAFPEKEITQETYQQYLNRLERRANGEPFAYITGEREFYGLSFQVNQETLIPRDDTEIIVDQALSLMPQATQTDYRLLDLGTGSGAIALALKKCRPDITVTAVDYYETTLKIAIANGERNQLEINWRQSDWFSALPQHHFDMIVSNPPYIDPLDQHLEGDGVKFEPKRALIAHDNGLADLYHIIDTAPNYFRKEGYLLLEHGYDQREALQLRMQERGYREIRTVKDYGNQDRVTIGFFPRLP
ncbi:peptide chain release factor N(5)-glutamine methyltransferase [Ignatzschineria ureiclastica]|uniref:Release factor glutamine methyltransferase n=1 Tax=Ignatzschineria ureiclastica TaxID=472582 RepID=A0A2U2AGQ9_9GAMM|nr:peptide chain release factor N(5)-glutamine methyltransferase [Ignatzschineria ureiclastica]PWD81838.1 peptide chain release factor N(5)-glutamine methyltransferase [Ignatzschineria ureiclastica]